MQTDSEGWYVQNDTLQKYVGWFYTRKGVIINEFMCIAYCTLGEQIRALHLSSFELWGTYLEGVRGDTDWWFLSSDWRAWAPSSLLVRPAWGFSVRRPTFDPTWRFTGCYTHTYTHTDQQSYIYGLTNPKFTLTLALPNELGGGRGALGKHPHTSKHST